MADIAFGETIQDEIVRRACEKIGVVCNDRADCGVVISSHANIAKLQNWEQMNVSTAIGSSVQYPGLGVQTDGRYVYYTPTDMASFVRFDSTKALADVTAWERMNKSTALGASPPVWSYYGGFGGFDGRYIYFPPWDSGTILRFDTTKSFTDVGSWERVGRSVALNSGIADGATGHSLVGSSFDGRYVYFSACSSDTFLRYDTTLPFTTSTAWERMNMSTAQKAATLNDAYGTSCFDGRYVYFGLNTSDTYLRFDTTLAFTNSGAWETMNVSTAKKAASVDYDTIGVCFDGRYVYHGAGNGLAHVRFDTSKSFTNSSAWEVMSLSTLAGTSTVKGGSYGQFDGRFVTFPTSPFTRYDTTKPFTNSSSWQLMSNTTAAGSGSDYGCGTAYDGKYIYFAPWGVFTYLRCVATPR